MHCGFKLSPHNRVSNVFPELVIIFMANFQLIITRGATVINTEIMITQKEREREKERKSERARVREL